MMMESGVEWPSKLQAAVLAANTGWKRSIQFTPFFIMYGREANCTHLLGHCNRSSFDEENLEPEISNSGESSDISPEPDHPDDWMKILEDSRSNTRAQARDNIRNEQMLQKHVFDKKVKNNRYFIIIQKHSFCSKII